MYFLSISILAQSDFFKNYNGIPITTNLWGKEAWMYDRYDFTDIDSAGIDAVVVTNTNAYLYENFRRANTKFKLIPNMHIKNTSRTGICFFSEKAYTVFEAEGDPDLAVNLDNSGGVEYYEGGIKGIKNNPNQNLSCNIIQGPDNYCNLAKSTIDSLPLDLKANFYIKINWRDVNNHPASIQNYLNLDICKLSITAKKDSALYDTTFAEKTIKVSDLLPLNGYKQITLPYFTSSKGVPENIIQQQERLTYETKLNLYTVIPNVKYHVYWYEIPDLSLYVDKIILFDPNGNALTTNGDLSSTSLPDEVNFRLFGDPLRNIILYIQNLNYYKVADPNFICSIQSGKWANDDDHILRKVHPSPIQFLYNTNLALLYGAKGIDVNDYYYYINDPNVENRTGMVGVYESYSGSYDLVPTPIWYTLRDTISPLLKGSFGKTLKKLQQNSQTFFSADSDEVHVGDANFYKNYNWEFDCGSFTPPNGDDKKYAMAVSRYYNCYTAVEDPNISPRLPDDNYFYIGCTVENGVNFKVYDHFNHETQYVFTTFSELFVRKNILPGEASLIEIMPSIKYGGYINADETINSSKTLIDNLTISPNKTLTISGINTTYTIMDTIEILNDGNINCINGGKMYGKNANIIFNGNAKITFDDWTKSLFFTNEGNHPKLIWGALSGNQVFYIYKVISGAEVLISTVVSTDESPKQSFVDLSTTINTSQIAGHDVYYKVGKLDGKQITKTNIINVPVCGGAIEKQLSTEVKTFKLEQNYPNPFNPTTTINYNIPATGRVNVKLYDMLGREVKTLFEGIQSMGSYNLEVNCKDMASGVYIYRIQYNDKILSKKMILQK